MLPWNFEQLGEYLDYQVLMSAAAVLLIYEGESVISSNPKIAQIHTLLEERTGKTTWVPSRSGTQGINFNEEGSFYRNKKRVLTSMLIAEDADEIRLLPFGRALAKGQISENVFYEFILTHFRYPHAGYKKNWDIWNAAEKRLYPFIFLLQVLVGLYEQSSGAAYLTSREVLFHLYPSSNHNEVAVLVSNICAERASGTSQPPRADDSTSRNITDLFGFLAKTGYALYINDRTVGLNLVGKHSTEKTFYLLQRKPQNQISENKLARIRELIAHTLNKR